jgi:hypothetical protein
MLLGIISQKGPEADSLVELNSSGCARLPMPNEDVLNVMTFKVAFKISVVAPVSNLSVTKERLVVVVQQKSPMGSLTMRRHVLEGVGRDGCSAITLNHELIFGKVLLARHWDLLT